MGDTCGLAPKNWISCRGCCSPEFDSTHSPTALCCPVVQNPSFLLEFLRLCEWHNYIGLFSEQELLTFGGVDPFTNLDESCGDPSRRMYIPHMPFSIQFPGASGPFDAHGPPIRNEALPARRKLRAGWECPRSVGGNRSHCCRQGR